VDLVDTHTCNSAAASFYLQISMLLAVLGGLSVLRRDAERLVLGPLRRMLKQVALYAKNPLAQMSESNKKNKKKKGFRRSRHSAAMTGDDDSDDDSVQDDEIDALGSYETEQLLSAVGKITDLLRKCWGVAGADIISTNLATQEGALAGQFNPTVPGKSVYALFGFAMINHFEHALKNLGGDVMILINDIAHIVHDEVFRWGYGDSGQCNKNLGEVFLMVFRIGLVKEVIIKLEQANNVIFDANKGAGAAVVQSTTRKRAGRKGSANSSQTAVVPRATASKKRASGRGSRASVAAPAEKKVNPQTLNLQSLPGISAFTDRAVMGMLKSFAGIHRDRKILNWTKDHRLNFGVGTFSINMIFGMDAGWAVEGAVGSEHKIDATYLSPHVNMSSRMMAACKM
jgi:hypothetical protein